MRPVLKGLCALIGILSAASCSLLPAPETSGEAQSEPEAEANMDDDEDPLFHIAVEHEAVEAFAIDAVYTAHPTRAPVDEVTIHHGSMIGRYLVHVEMTGAPQARGIYNVVVHEEDDGALELIELTKLQ